MNLFQIDSRPWAAQTFVAAMACGSAKKEFRRLAFLVLALSLVFALVSASAPCVSSLSVELGLALVSASAPCAAGQGAKADVADQDYHSAPA